MSMALGTVAVELYIQSSATVNVWYAGAAASWRAKLDAYSSSQHYLQDSRLTCTGVLPAKHSVCFSARKGERARGNNIDMQ